MAWHTLFLHLLIDSYWNFITLDCPECAAEDHEVEYFSGQGKLHL